MSGKRVDMACVSGRNDFCREWPNGDLPGGDQGVFGFQNGEYMLSAGVVGHPQVIDEVDAKDIVVQMFTDH